MRNLTATVVALLLVGCAGEADPPSADTPAVPDAVDGSDDPDGPDVDGPDAADPDADDTGDAGEQDPAASSDAVLGEETMAAIDAVVGDGVDRDDVEVVDASFVTWPDGSLGCPEPDMLYTQALVEGFRILLDADGEEVAFHGETQGRMIRCDDPQPPVDGSSTS